MAGKTSRPEGIFNVGSTARDGNGRYSLMEYFDKDKGLVVLRGIEGTDGITVELVDADGSPATLGHVLRISGSGTSLQDMKWLAQPNPPSPSQGDNGDMFIDTTNGSLYVKSNNIWELKGSLRGEQGPAGPQGSTGPAGPQGPQGIQGRAGPVGPTGNAGVAGPQGVRGPQGAHGETGVPGPVGPRGEAGPTITPNEYGRLTNAKIEEIEQINQDWNFLVIANGDIRTTTTTPGIQDNMSGHLLRYEALEGIWIDLGPIVGVAGPAGVQGNTGAAGPRGLQGPAGLEGPQGPQGPQGITGPAGLQGPTGATGATGATGTPGIAGPRGPQGEQGIAGPQGPVGPQGVQGLTGATGAIGPKGERGDTGTPGLQGLPGADGEDGAPGVGVPAGGTTGQVLAKSSGADHATQWVDAGTASVEVSEDEGNIIEMRVDGLFVEVTQGPIGEIGPQGPQGEVGPAGAQGEKGDTGDTGPQGIQGIPGEQGPQGEAGPAGTSLSVSGYVDSVEDLPIDPSDGDTYIVGETLYVAKDGGWGSTGIVSGPVGPQGPQGERGETGADGRSLQVSGRVDSVDDLPETANDGDAYIVGNTVYIFSNGTWGSTDVVQGPKGDTGETGAPGVDGVDGAPGEQGPQGEVGPAGIQGIQGPVGADGIDGNNLNVKGHVTDEADLPVTGNENGDAFLVNEDFYVYYEGTWRGVGVTQGPIGPRGLQGEKGNQGERGEQGIQGLRGETGERGERGETGEQGPAGADGRDGVDGAPGSGGESRILLRTINLINGLSQEVVTGLNSANYDHMYITYVGFCSSDPLGILTLQVGTNTHLTTGYLSSHDNSTGTTTTGHIPLSSSGVNSSNRATGNIMLRRNRELCEGAFRTNGSNNVQRRSSSILPISDWTRIRFATSSGTFQGGITIRIYGVR